MGSAVVRYLCRLSRFLSVSHYHWVLTGSSHHKGTFDSVLVVVVVHGIRAYSWRGPGLTWRRVEFTALSPPAVDGRSAVQTVKAGCKERTSLRATGISLRGPSRLSNAVVIQDLDRFALVGPVGKVRPRTLECSGERIQFRRTDDLLPDVDALGARPAILLNIMSS